MNIVASMSLKWCLFDKTEQTERESADYGYYISSLYKSYGQKDKRCGKIHNLSDKVMNINNNLEQLYCVFFFFFAKLCKWNSVVQQDLEQHPETPRTVLNFKLMLFN